MYLKRQFFTLCLLCIATWQSHQNLLPSSLTSSECLWVDTLAMVRCDSHCVTKQNKDAHLGGKSSQDPSRGGEASSICHVVLKRFRSS